MSYTQPVAFSYIPGETLYAQLLDTTLADVGAELTSGIAEVGSNGHYTYAATIDDGFVGYIKFYTSGDSGDVVALFAISAVMGQAAIADAVLDEVVEATAPANAQTLRQLVRLIVAAMYGKSSLDEDGQTVRFRDLGDSKDRVVGQIDSNGYRTGVTTLDGS